MKGFFERAYHLRQDKGIEQSGVEQGFRGSGLAVLAGELPDDFKDFLTHSSLIHIC